MKKEKKDSKTSVHFVGLKSIEDMARMVSTFGDGFRPVFAFRERGELRLFAQGPKLGDTRLVFFADSKKQGNFVVYQPRTLSGSGTIEIKETMPLQLQNHDLQSIPIIELMKSPFGKEENKVKIKCIGIRDYAAVIKGVIIAAMDNGEIGRVYSFNYKSECYIGSFALMDGDDEKTFCYAKVPNAKSLSFFRYNYSNDKVEQSEIFGEHSYLYVRVINLGAPFTFFKPE